MSRSRSSSSSGVTSTAIARPLRVTTTGPFSLAFRYALNFALISATEAIFTTSQFIHYGLPDEGTFRFVNRQDVIANRWSVDDREWLPFHLTIIMVILSECVNEERQAAICSRGFGWRPCRAISISWRRTPEFANESGVHVNSSPSSGRGS